VFHNRNSSYIADCARLQLGYGAFVVPSPCTQVCEIDPQTGWCLGCARTLEEIGSWNTASDRERAAILVCLVARRKLPVSRSG